MYYAVEDPAGEVVQVVEADFPKEARDAVGEDFEGEGSLFAREATDQERFSFLVERSGLSHTKLSERLDVSRGYIGQRVRGDASTRYLDVLAMERFLQLQEQKG